MVFICIFSYTLRGFPFRMESFEQYDLCVAFRYPRFFEQCAFAMDGRALQGLDQTFTTFLFVVYYLVLFLWLFLVVLTFACLFYVFMSCYVCCCYSCFLFLVLSSYVNSIIIIVLFCLFVDFCFVSTP